MVQAEQSVNNKSSIISECAVSIQCACTSTVFFYGVIRFLEIGEGHHKLFLCLRYGIMDLRFLNPSWYSPNCGFTCSSTLVWRAFERTF